MISQVFNFVIIYFWNNSCIAFCKICVNFLISKKKKEKGERFVLCIYNNIIKILTYTLYYFMNKFKSDLSNKYLYILHCVLQNFYMIFKEEKKNYTFITYIGHERTPRESIIYIIFMNVCNVGRYIMFSLYY